MKKRGKYVTSTKRRKSTKTLNIGDTNDLVTVILICDTPGYRMKSYGPPPLITVRGKKIIDHQIEAISERLKNFEIILCVGFSSDKVAKYIRQSHVGLNIRIVENQVFNTSNACESIRLALNNTLNDKVMIADGNILFDADMLNQINIQHSSVLCESQPSENLEVGFNLNEEEDIEHFAYGASHLWSEVLFLNNAEIIDSLRKIVSGSDYKTKFIFEALNDLIKTRHSLKMINNIYPVIKVNNIKTYHKIKGKK